MKCKIIDPINNFISKRHDFSTGNHLYWNSNLTNFRGPSFWDDVNVTITL